MRKKSTEELNKLLGSKKPDQLGEYLKSSREFLINDKKAFYYYMKDIFDEKRIKLKDVYIYAGVSESYGEKILSMTKHTRNRDLILRFCLAGHCNWQETNRALKLYGMNELYAKDARDACIIVAINNRIFNLDKIDEMLSGHGLKKITREEQKDT